MIQLKQYQRENLSQGFCSAIFMTMHMGNQIVLWEITNYPKIKMKMIWFYIIQEKL